ncbi:MAG: class I SAM-dependent rRNA methyltransferase [Candidatus Falkowbacteria bacterium]
MIDLKLESNRVGPVKGRHPWVFSRALTRIPDGIGSGEPVRLFDGRGEFLASGYFNSYSQIAVRIWGYDKNEKVDRDFFRRRIDRALAWREQYIDGEKTDAYRLINGENDSLPGLVIDRYGPYLAVQFHTAGMERWREEITEALVAASKPAGIYERSDLKVRSLNNETPKTGIICGKIPDLINIRENGFRFSVNIKEGQKTGFFLDQRDKRAALSKYCRGREILNCFSYTGGFSVYALAAGAKRVVNVDLSEAALEIAKRNMKLNGLDLKRAEFIRADVKDYLARLEPGKFPLIILDPPAFIKDRRKIKEGMNGYRRINTLALEKISLPGMLLTCSCSTHLKRDDFRFLLGEAGSRACRTLRIIESYTHGLDHPELVPFTEGEYLKVFFLAVDK